MGGVEEGMKLIGIGVLVLGLRLCWWSESALLMFVLKRSSFTGSMLMVPL